MGKIFKYVLYVPIDQYEARYKFNPIRWLEVIFCIVCLFLTITLVLSRSELIGITVQVVPLAIATTALIITLADTFANCCLQPINWNVWIFITTTIGLAYFVGAGIWLANVVAKVNDVRLCHIIFIVTGVIYLIDAFVILYYAQRESSLIEPHETDSERIRRLQRAGKIQPIKKKGSSSESSDDSSKPTFRSGQGDQIEERKDQKRTSMSYGGTFPMNRDGAPLPSPKEDQYERPQRVTSPTNVRNQDNTYQQVPYGMAYRRGRDEQLMRGREEPPMRERDEPGMMRRREEPIMRESRYDQQAQPRDRRPVPLNDGRQGAMDQQGIVYNNAGRPIAVNEAVLYNYCNCVCSQKANGRPQPYPGAYSNAAPNEEMQNVAARKGLLYRNGSWSTRDGKPVDRVTSLESLTQYTGGGRGGYTNQRRASYLAGRQDPRGAYPNQTYERQTAAAPLNQDPRAYQNQQYYDSNRPPPNQDQRIYAAGGTIPYQTYDNQTQQQQQEPRTYQSDYPDERYEKERAAENYASPDQQTRSNDAVYHKDGWYDKDGNRVKNVHEKLNTLPSIQCCSGRGKKPGTKICKSKNCPRVHTLHMDEKKQPTEEMKKHLEKQGIYYHTAGWYTKDGQKLSSVDEEKPVEEQQQQKDIANTTQQAPPPQTQYDDEKATRQYYDNLNAAAYSRQQAQQPYYNEKDTTEQPPSSYYDNRRASYYDQQVPPLAGAYYNQQGPPPAAGYYNQQEVSRQPPSRPEYYDQAGPSSYYNQAGSPVDERYTAQKVVPVAAAYPSEKAKDEQEKKKPTISEKMKQSLARRGIIYRGSNWYTKDGKKIPNIGPLDSVENLSSESEHTDISALKEKVSSPGVIYRDGEWYTQDGRKIPPVKTSADGRLVNAKGTPLMRIIVGCNTLFVDGEGFLYTPDGIPYGHSTCITDISRQTRVLGPRTSYEVFKTKQVIRTQGLNNLQPFPSNVTITKTEKCKMFLSDGTPLAEIRTASGTLMYETPTGQLLQCVQKNQTQTQAIEKPKSAPVKEASRTVSTSARMVAKKPQSAPTRIACPMRSQQQMVCQQPKPCRCGKIHYQITPSVSTRTCPFYIPSPEPERKLSSITSEPKKIEAPQQRKLSTISEYSNESDSIQQKISPQSPRVYTIRKDATCCRTATTERRSSAPPQYVVKSTPERSNSAPTKSETSTSEADGASTSSGGRKSSPRAVETEVSVSVALGTDKTAAEPTNESKK